MLRIVLDTDVVFAAFDSAQGASRQVLLEILELRANLLLSTSLLLEYEAVLTRPENLARFDLAISEVLTVLDEMSAICIPVIQDWRWRPIATDPDDDLVLETAVNGFADAIASFNIRHLKQGAALFGIPVERPAQLLRRIAT